MKLTPGDHTFLFESDDGAQVGVTLWVGWNKDGEVELGQVDVKVRPERSSIWSLPLRAARY